MHSESPPVFDTSVVGHSSWREHVLRGPRHGGHWNHKAFRAPSGKLHQNLWVSHQDPCRGGLHHHLLRGHSWEPTAYWRILQVRPASAAASVVLGALQSANRGSTLLCPPPQQLCRCRERHRRPGRWHGLKTVGSQLPHAGHPLEIKTCT